MDIGTIVLIVSFSALVLFCILGCCLPSLPCPWCFQWGTRAGRHAPSVTALHKTYKYDGKVVIIGAGASGLAAAKVLEKNNISYTILEATNRFGGRVMENNTFTDFPMDLGAEWIHNRADILDVCSGVEGTAAETELIPYKLQNTRGDYGMLTLWWYFFPEQKFKRSTWFSFVRQHFAEHVKYRIQYNSPVTEVDYSGKRIMIKTRSSSEGKSKHGEFDIVADKVIITVPVGVLQAGDITFKPPLSQRRKDALASVPFLPGFKMFLKFSEKFYPDFVFYSEHKGFYDMAFKKETKENVLAFLVTGGSTEAYYALESEQAMVDAAIEELDQMFNGTASRTFTRQYQLEDWGRKEFTKGSWVELPRISASTLHAVNEPLESKVYFAGELHEVSRQLGVPGAILSGLHTVDIMLSCQNTR